MNKIFDLKRYLMDGFNLWDWLAANPSESKPEWPGWKIINAEVDEGYYSNCPCCEYVYQEYPNITINGSNVCASKCPLQSTWPNGCCSFDSPYHIYGNVLFEDQKKHYATIIRDAFKTKLDKLNKDL